LLHAWWCHIGRVGTLHREVHVGGATGPWPGAKLRALDAMRVVPGSGDVAGGLAFHAARAHAAWEIVEAIEVKPGLSEAVIGQLLVGRWMLAQHVDVTPTKAIALVRHVDEAMRWVASQLGIDVEHFPARSKPNNPMQGRPLYALDSPRLRMLRHMRGTLDGKIVTRVPLAGPAGPGEWVGSTEIYLPYLRILGTSDASIVVCEAGAHARDLIDGADVDIIVLVPGGEIGRGAVGRAIAHRLMLAHQYRPASVSATIVCERPDAAMTAAAAALGVRVLVA
jgi:hypothetical protein